MGALKLSYYNRQRALEVNSLFLVKGLEKNALLEKNRVSSSTYGLQGQEKDDEIKGNGNHLSFEDFGYDPKLGGGILTQKLEKPLGKVLTFMQQIIQLHLLISMEKEIFIIIW